MGQITKAGAWCNGEVAYLAWEADGAIADCLGFMIARIHLTGADAGVRRILPTWIAFNDQSNPNWEDQDSSVWPIQSYQWRDLTLRKSRDTTNVRPIDFAVRYEITPVGLPGPGRAKVDPPERAAYRDANNQPRYTGAPRDLFVVGPTVVTNTVEVTHAYAADAGGPLVEATFTNGILSTQNLIKQLRAAAPAAAAAANTTAGLLTTLKTEIKKVESPIRAFLTGDVLAFLERLVDRAETEGGQVHMALYELDDPELNALLIKTAQAGRLRLILSTAANTDPNAKGTPAALRKPVVWDVENNGVREDLHAAAAGGSTVQDRMFNNADVIGHNKFAVYVKNGVAQSVLTGSTNWTQTGLCTQSNNAIIVHDKAVAGAYLAYWKRLEADAQPARVPLEVQVGNKTIEGSAANDATQGAVLRTGNSQVFGPFTLNDDATKTQLWCSPNTPSPNRNEHSPTPPDLNDVYWLMAHANEAVFFLSFMPGESGRQNIIGEAAKLAADRPDLLVLGAISDPKAMPNYQRPKPGQPDPNKVTMPNGEIVRLPMPSIWWPAGDASKVAMVRATAISTPLGDMRPELLSAGHAIIHDKIIVIDPLDPDRCAVITGSHNNGYKASYQNDENLLIIKGNSALATCYAVHVIDLYDHYVLRAKLEDEKRKALIAAAAPPAAPAPAAPPPAPAPVGKGFLKTDVSWQAKFFPRPQSALDYFLKHA